ncbi:Alternative cytochrome c oxidase subunit 1 [compost metagenome]
MHGNWRAQLPVVHRWAYDYSVPGVDQDYVPQTVSREELERMKQRSGAAATGDRP